jgi:hypothetical protein
MNATIQAAIAELEHERDRLTAAIDTLRGLGGAATPARRLRTNERTNEHDQSQSGGSSVDRAPARTLTTRPSRTRSSPRSRTDRNVHVMLRRRSAAIRTPFDSPSSVSRPKAAYAPKARPTIAGGC